jgi:hypothetical protein
MACSGDVYLFIGEKKLQSAYIKGLMKAQHQTNILNAI